MSSGVCAWLFVLLAVTFISSNHEISDLALEEEGGTSKPNNSAQELSTEAIKCYDCIHHCPDKTKLALPKECIKSTLSRNYTQYFSKIDENIPTEPNEDTKKIEILTCYKVVERNGSSETVLRGCSPYLTPKVKECASNKGEELCLYVCEEDECNKAPVTIAPTAIACLLVLLTLFIV